MGVLVVLQARLNDQLATDVGDGILAAVLSFLSGLVVLLVILAFRPTTRSGVTRRLPAELRAGRLRWWMLIGGLGGATLVASQGVSVPVLGVALVTVLIVAGTTGSSLLVDRWGLGPGGPRAVTTPRVVAAVGTTLGVAVAVSGRFASGSLAWGAVGLAFVAGVAVSFQQAVNGRVAAQTGDPLVATLVNFLVGLTGLLVLLGLEHVVSAPTWHAPPAPWSDPLLWLGGPIGVAFVVTAAHVVRPLGVLLFSLLTIAGQLAGSLVSDLLFPTTGSQVGWQLVTGLALTGAAVAYAGVPRARS